MENVISRLIHNLHVISLELLTELLHGAFTPFPTSPIIFIGLLCGKPLHIVLLSVAMAGRTLGSYCPNAYPACHRLLR